MNRHLRRALVGSLVIAGTSVPAVDLMIAAENIEHDREARIEGYVSIAEQTEEPRPAGDGPAAMAAVSERGG